MTTRKTLIVGLTVLTAVALAGCGTTRAGSAAIVGDTRITETRVNQGAEEAVVAAATLPEDPGSTLDQAQLMRENANRLVNSELIRITAEEEGIVVTQAEIDQLLAQAAGGQPREILDATIAAQLGVPPSELEAFAYDFLVQSQLGEQLAPGLDPASQQAATRQRIAQTADRVGVSISPRYGAWDPATVVIVPLTEDWTADATPAVDPFAPELQ